MVEGVVVTRRKADVVEHEKFGFRTDIDRIADAELRYIGLSTFGGGPRVAFVKLAGRGLDDVAEDDQHRRCGERIDINGIEVRLQDHVGLVDRLPARDGRTIEHEPVGQHVLVDDGRDHGEVLPLAAQVGEADVHPLDVFVLDALENV